MTTAQYTKTHYNLKLSEVAQESGFSVQVLDKWFNSDDETQTKKFESALLGVVAKRFLGVKCPPLEAINP
jgi:hypothetical protein